jgi:hypothetical protein
MGKYQMIKPYNSEKIYESSNINKCAKKFYDLIKFDSAKHQYFILKNIDNNEFHKFEIPKNKPEVGTTKTGMTGGYDEKQENNNFKYLEIKFNEIDLRISNIESKLNKKDTETKPETKSENTIKNSNEQNDIQIKNQSGSLITPPKSKESKFCSIS